MRAKMATSIANDIDNCLHGGPAYGSYHGQPWFDATFSQLFAWSTLHNQTLTMPVTIQYLDSMNQLVFSNPLSIRMVASNSISAWADGNDLICRHCLVAAELISLCVTHGKPKVKLLLETEQTEQAKFVREQLLRCMSVDRAVQAAELRRLSSCACQCMNTIEKLSASGEYTKVVEERWKHPILNDHSEMYF